MLTLTDRAPAGFVASWVVVGAFAAGAVAATALSGLAAGALLLTAGFTALAAHVDLRTNRLPDDLLVAAAAPLLALLAWASFETGDVRTPTLALTAGAAAFCLPVLAVHLVAPSAMGFGDVKLTAVLGAALGVPDWRLSVFALCLASGGTAAAGLAMRRSSLPFGPGLVLASVVTGAAFLVSKGLPGWP